ncbi:MAG: signal peptide peptidase SppA [Pseudomonadota bacterium]
MDPITRDFYEERRRSWRRSAFWRGFLVAGIIAGLVIAALLVRRDAPLGPHIARVEISGIILDNLPRERLLARLADAENARALVVHIDSPGGAVAASEALYEGLRRIAEEKPVVAVMDGVAASGGYLAAIGADHIVARGNTVTGSIGVIFEYLVFSDLIERLGVDVETVRSSDLKAATSPTRPLSPAARAAEQALVNETFAWFRDLVAERRELTAAQTGAATDGRTFTGRMALELGLIDAIGAEPAALAHLESLNPGLADLPVRAWKLESRQRGLAGFVSGLLDISPNYAAQRLPGGPRLMSILY